MVINSKCVFKLARESNLDISYMELFFCGERGRSICTFHIDSTRMYNSSLKFQETGSEFPKLNLYIGRGNNIYTNTSYIYCWWIKLSSIGLTRSRKTIYSSVNPRFNTIFLICSRFSSVILLIVGSVWEDKKLKLFMKMSFILDFGL